MISPDMIGTNIRGDFENYCTNSHRLTSFFPFTLCLIQFKGTYGEQHNLLPNYKKAKFFCFEEIIHAMAFLQMNTAYFIPISFLLLCLCPIIYAKCKCPGKDLNSDFDVYAKELEDGERKENGQKIVHSDKGNAKILSNEPDSLITCLNGGGYKWDDKEVNAELFKDGCLVVKDVFSTEYFENKKVDTEKKKEMMKRWGKLDKIAVKMLGYKKVAKPKFMLEHELTIFNLWGQNNPDSPVARLFKDVNRAYSVVMMMELGKPLTDHVKKRCEEWMEKSVASVNINKEIEQMVVQIATTLKAFHEKVLHLHLKPGNWVYVEREGKEVKELKLIDFQTALQINQLKPLYEKYGKNKGYKVSQDEQVQVEDLLDGSELKTDEAQVENLKQMAKARRSQVVPYSNQDGHGEKKNEESLEEMVEFLCNSQWNEMGLPKLTGAMTAHQRPSTYASPEHKEACQVLKKKENKNDEMYGYQLSQITVKSDIWAVGILLIEILAQTPTLMRLIYKSHGYRTKIVAKVTNKSKEDEMRAENFVVLRAQFLNGGKKLNHRAHKDLGKNLHKAVKAEFPAISTLLEKIFVPEPKERPDLDQILTCFAKEDIDKKGKCLMEKKED